MYRPKQNRAGLQTRIEPEAAIWRVKKTKTAIYFGIINIDAATTENQSNMSVARSKTTPEAQ